MSAFSAFAIALTVIAVVFSMCLLWWATRPEEFEESDDEYDEADLWFITYIVWEQKHDRL